MGKDISDRKLEYQDLLTLVAKPLCQLLEMANDTRSKYIGQRLELCSILNAKSGACTEDCKFCAQSQHYNTQSPIFPLKDLDEIITCAQEAKNNGAMRFSLVTSGKFLDKKDFNKIVKIIETLKEKVDVKLCASLGSINRKNLNILKAAGLDRYHHNIESSQDYFPNITTTHSFLDRINTIKRIKEAGLEACSGGIIGLGESMRDRLKMLLCLNDLGVDAIALNILIPIPGTALEKKTPLSALEVIKTICIFRLASRNKTIIIAAGRFNDLKDCQGLLFLGGANGLMIGNYLTTKGRSITEDNKLIAQIKSLWSG